MQISLSAERGLSGALALQICEGYKFVTQCSSINTTKLIKVLLEKKILDPEKIKNLGEFTLLDMDTTSILFGTSSCCDIEHGLTLHIFSDDIDRIEAMVNIAQHNCLVVNTDKIQMQSFFIGANDTLNWAWAKITPEELDYLDADFYPFLNVDRMFEKFHKGNEPLLALLGKPGLGKSKLIPHYIQWMISNVSKDTITIAQVRSVDVLLHDEFWANISDFDYLVLDDIHTEIIDRKTSKDGSHLQKLLSNLDGILKSKVKVIISSNLDVAEIDDALLRPGRCFDCLEFRPLSTEEANSILRKYGLPLMDVAPIRTHTQAEIGQIIENISAYGEDKRDYLKERRISAIEFKRR